MASLDQTKARLLDAAGEEFAEKGFDGATVRSICARAGVNLAAVNYHFGDKEQLYLQALMEAHRCGVGMPPDDEFFQGSPADQLRRFVRHFLQNMLAIEGTNTWTQTLMLREMLRPTRACEVLVREVVRPKFERLRAILKQVCPEADEKRLTVIAFSIIGQCLHYRLGRGIGRLVIGPEQYAALDVDYLTEHISAFSLAALGQAPPLDATGRPAQVGKTEGEGSCAGSR